MKRILFYSFLILITLLIILSKFGFQIGDTKFGNQVDLEVNQKNDLINSHFYKNYFLSDKLLIINTWATWCKPCIEEMDGLNSLKSNFLNDSVLFLSLSIDKDSLQLKNFIESKKFKFIDFSFENLSYRSAIINTLDKKEIDKFILVESVPNTYIVKNMKVIEKIEGQVDIEHLKKLINVNK